MIMIQNNDISKRIDDMLRINYRLKPQQVMCEEPTVVFNQNVIPYLVNDHVISGKKRSGIYKSEFDFSRFNPWKRGIVRYKYATAYNKQQFVKKVEEDGNEIYDVRRERVIDYDKVDTSYVITPFGVQPIFLVVPCGKCELCREKQVQQWCTRAMLESEGYNDYPMFVTLTYDEAHLPEDGLSEESVTLFVKRLRKFLGKERIKYMVCGEYGSKHGRPHYHFMFFGISRRPEETYQQYFYRVTDVCCKAWSGDLRSNNARTFVRYKGNKQDGDGFKLYEEQIGMVCVKPVEKNARGVASYVTKYMLKGSNAKKGQNPCFFHYSKSFGKEFVLAHKKDIIQWLLSDVNENFKMKSKFGGQVTDVHFTKTMLDYIVPRLAKAISAELRRILNDYSYQIMLEGQIKRTISSDVWRYNEIVYLFNKMLRKFEKYEGVLYRPLRMLHMPEEPVSDWQDAIKKPICVEDLMDWEKIIETMSSFDEKKLDEIYEACLLRNRYAQKMSNIYSNTKITKQDVKSYRNKIRKKYADIEERSIF